MIAVAAFTDLSGEATSSGNYLSEQLLMELSKTPEGPGVFDRTELARILRRSGLAIEGAPDAGLLLDTLESTGIDFLVAGLATEGDEEVAVIARVINVRSSEVIYAEEFRVPRGDLPSRPRQAPGRSQQREHDQREREALLDDEDSSSRSTPVKVAKQYGFEFRLNECLKVDIGIRCNLEILSDFTRAFSLVSAQISDDSGRIHEGAARMDSPSATELDGQKTASASILFRGDFDATETLPALVISYQAGVGSQVSFQDVLLMENKN